MSMHMLTTTPCWSSFSYILFVPNNSWRWVQTSSTEVITSYATTFLFLLPRHTTSVCRAFFRQPCLASVRISILLFDDSWIREFFLQIILLPKSEKQMNLLKHNIGFKFWVSLLRNIITSRSHKHSRNDSVVRRWFLYFDDKPQLIHKCDWITDDLLILVHYSINTICHGVNMTFKEIRELWDFKKYGQNHTPPR